MKEIKTNSYMGKEAQFNRLPGDPSLPPGVRMRDIDPGEQKVNSGTDVFDINYGDSTYKVLADYEISDYSDDNVVDLSTDVFIKKVEDMRGNDLTSELGNSAFEDFAKNEIRESIRESHSQ